MTPFSHSEGRRAFENFYEWMIPPPKFGVYKPDYFTLIFDIVLFPDPLLEPPYDPVKDGVELEIGFDIWVCACMLDSAVNHTDYAQDCIDYAAQYKQLCEVIQHMLLKKSFGKRKSVYSTDRLRHKAASALQYITGSICKSELTEEYRTRRQEFLLSIASLRKRLLSVATSDNTVCDCE